MGLIQSITTDPERCGKTKRELWKHWSTISYSITIHNFSKAVMVILILWLAVGTYGLSMNQNNETPISQPRAKLNTTMKDKYCAANVGAFTASLFSSGISVTIFGLKKTRPVAVVDSISGSRDTFWSIQLRKLLILLKEIKSFFNRNRTHGLLIIINGIVSCLYLGLEGLYCDDGRWFLTIPLFLFHLVLIMMRVFIHVNVRDNHIDDGTNPGST
jgi:hypothetical protein